jgi:RNA polymerase sigma-32 factor
VTAKADAKKTAKPRAASRAAAGHRKAQPQTDETDETAGEPSEAGEDDSLDSGEAEPETFEAEGELVDDAEPDEEDVEPSEDSELTDEPDAEPKNEAGIARYDALQAYMREVQRHPLLSADEEHKLAIEYTKTQATDVAARLVTANLRLVVKIAYEYRRAYRNMMDLVQEGNIGLMQAVKRYDPYRGVKLSSYAAWWIRAYMLRFILNNWRLVKVGTTQAQRKLFFNLN